LFSWVRGAELALGVMLVWKDFADKRGRDWVECYAIGGACEHSSYKNAVMSYADKLRKIEWALE
jgi:hypothetical protein